MLFLVISLDPPLLLLLMLRLESLSTTSTFFKLYTWFDWSDKCTNIFCIAIAS